MTQNTTMINQVIQPYDGCFVKLFVSQKTNEEMYSRLIERFYNEINVHELVIVEDPESDIRSTVREDILDQGEDTNTFLNNYVDQIDTDLDKRKLKEFNKELYVEARMSERKESYTRTCGRIKKWVRQKILIILI